MGGVVGDDDDLGLGVGVLEVAQHAFFLDIDGAEDDVEPFGDAGDLRCVENDHIAQVFGDGIGHHPAAADGFRVGLAGGAGRGGELRDAEPRVIGKQGGEALTDHAGRADDTGVINFHGAKTSFYRECVIVRWTP